MRHAPHLRGLDARMQLKVSSEGQKYVCNQLMDMIERITFYRGARASAGVSNCQSRVTELMGNRFVCVVSYRVERGALFSSAPATGQTRELDHDCRIRLIRC